MATAATRPCIIGTGCHAPGEPISNERFGADVDAFLRRERNIFARHFIAPSQSTSDLVVPAAESAMRKAGITAADLDLIVVATDTPDHPSPPTAAVVQHKLGARRAGVFDLNAACAGFVTALDVAGRFVAGPPRARHALVAGAYAMSRYIEPADYKSASVFADGAGAVVLTASPGPGGILASRLHADGQFHDAMGLYAEPGKAPTLQFRRRLPPEFNTIIWPEMLLSMLSDAGRRIEDVRRLFMTQLNIGTINATLDRLGAPHTLSHNIMDRFGYTGSACIPMALADADARGLLRSGDLIGLLASGGGVAIAGMVLEWEAA